VPLRGVHGRRSPGLDGGCVGPYGPGWRAARRRVLDRDGHACVRCVTTREQLGHDPDVHHVVPVRRLVDHPVTAVADAHYAGNLACLCPSWHREVEARPPARRPTIWSRHAVGSGPLTWVARRYKCLSADTFSVSRPTIETCTLRRRMGGTGGVLGQ